MEELTTEAPADPPVTSDMPPAVYWVVWMGVFAVVTWGFMHVFGSHEKPS